MEYRFSSIEEKLLHIIRLNGSTYKEYLETAAQVQNLNYTDSNGRSFLHTAVTNEKNEIALDLIHRGINLDIQDVNGDTAAMFMVSNNKWDLLDVLLQYHPDVNLENWLYGRTLLHYIVQCTNKERNYFAQKLVQAGADPYMEDRYGHSPLDFVIALQNQELIDCFSQVEKQDSEKRFRIPKNTSGIFSIKIKEYMKYILVEGLPLSHLEKKITSYAEICTGKMKSYTFKLIPVAHTDWIIINCPDKMDFYNYHNLMSWFWGTSEDICIPKQNICVALHEDSRLSYYGVIADLKYGDRLIGRFQNRESFCIYLPDAYKKGGNAKSCKNELPVTSISQYLFSCGFDDKWLNCYVKMPYHEITVEMAT